MTPDGWTPQPGELVVVARFDSAVEGHWLDGTVVEYQVTCSSGWYHRVRGLDMLWGVWVREIRPATPGEQARYWLDRNPGGGA